MTERFLHHLRVELPPAEETAAIARSRLAVRANKPGIEARLHCITLSL